MTHRTLTISILVLLVLGLMTSAIVAIQNQQIVALRDAVMRLSEQIEDRFSDENVNRTAGTVLLPEDVPLAQSPGDISVKNEQVRREGDRVVYENEWFSFSVDADMVIPESLHMAPEAHFNYFDYAKDYYTSFPNELGGDRAAVRAYLDQVMQTDLFPTMYIQTPTYGTYFKKGKGFRLLLAANPGGAGHVDSESARYFGCCEAAAPSAQASEHVIVILDFPYSGGPTPQDPILDEIKETLRFKK